MSDAHGDFDYRELSGDRPRRSTTRLDRGARSSFVDVTPPSTPVAVEVAAAAVADVATTAADDHVAVEAAAVRVQFAATAVPSLAKQMHAASSDDWAADEQSRVEVRSQQQISNLAAMRRESMRISARGTGAASQHHIDMHAGHHPGVPPSPHAATRLSIHPSESLHGKDLRQFVSIASIEPIARHSNSVDWSETMANPDETDHLSLMDPYYDLTRSKLTKLFSLFHPDGACGA